MRTVSIFLLIAYGRVAYGVDAISYPQTLVSGGGVQTSADYLQYASEIGGIEATETASADVSGRYGYVSQLSDSSNFNLGGTVYAVHRSDGVVSIPIVRTGDATDQGLIGFALHCENEPPTGGLTPATGQITFGPGQLDGTLELNIGAGGATNVLVSLVQVESESLVAEPAAALITLTNSLPLINQLISLIGPQILSNPPLVAVTGEDWQYEVVINPDGLLLPHALTPIGQLEFSLLDAPAGATIIKTGPLRARVTWPSASGNDDLHSVKLLVRDALTGLSDIQEVMLYVLSQPQAGG